MRCPEAVARCITLYCAVSERIVIAELADEPAFSEDMDALCARLDDIEAPQVPDVILDMRGVGYLNSSNLAQLLRLRKKLAHSDKRLRICSVSDGVWSVLLTTGLDALFTFNDDVSTSLAGLWLARLVETPLESAL